MNSENCSQPKGAGISWNEAPFVETEVIQDLRAFAKRCCDLQTVGIVLGDGGVGKTRTLTESQEWFQSQGIMSRIFKADMCYNQSQALRCLESVFTGGLTMDSGVGAGPILENIRLGLMRMNVRLLIIDNADFVPGAFYTMACSILEYCKERNHQLGIVLVGRPGRRLSSILRDVPSEVFGFRRIGVLRESEVCQVLTAWIPEGSQYWSNQQMLRKITLVTGGNFEKLRQFSVLLKLHSNDGSEITANSVHNAFAEMRGFLFQQQLALLPLAA